MRRGVHETIDLLQVRLNLCTDAIYDTFFALGPSPSQTDLDAPAPPLSARSMGQK